MILLTNPDLLNTDDEIQQLIIESGLRIEDAEVPKDLDTPDYRRMCWKQQAEQKIKEKYERQVRIKSYWDLSRMKFKRSWLVKEVIPVGVLIMVYSPPAEFKSLLSQYLALCIATGKDFLGFKTVKNKVLISDFENSKQIVAERLKSLKKGLNLRSNSLPIFYLDEDFVDFANEGHQRLVPRLIETCRLHSIKLIILDTLHRHANYDENHASDLNRIYVDVFKPLVNKGITVIFLHHTNKDKAKTYRGSIDFLGQCDLVFKISRYGKTERFELVNEKNRYGELDTITGEILFNDEKIVIQKTKAETSEEKSKSKWVEATNRIKAVFNENKDDILKLADVVDYLEAQQLSKISTTTISRVLKWLVKKQELEHHGKKGYSLPKTLPVSEVDLSD